jgi:hypothetical protein
MMRFYYYLRCAHPFLFFVLVAILTLVILIPVLSSDMVTQAIGGDKLTYRAHALKSALSWQWRATMIGNGKSNLVVPVRMYGNIVTMNPDGTATIVVASGKEFKTMKINLANLVINNMPGIQSMVKAHEKDDAVIDLYDTNAVIWIARRPFNLDLVNAGYATPLENPPTNIVELMYANYFWRESGLGGD